MALPERNINALLSVALSFLIFVSLPSEAKCQVRLSAGETVYVSIYSNVYSGPKKLPFQLAAMLSIRNTDPKYPITILKADYYDDHGVMIDSYVSEAMVLKPLASTHFYLREYDKRGGPGANFIVQWRSAVEVNQPIIEGIMLGLMSGQGLSFTCPGQIIKEHRE
jgi:hypothetical protein